MCQSSFDQLKGGVIVGSKFLGVGLTNALGIAFLTLFVSCLLKVVFTMYEVDGLSDVIRTA